MKTMVVTGATGGIGRQTAIALARTGARVVLTGRDRARGEEGLRVVREASGSTEVHLVLGDLASLEATRALARELSERFGPLDVLVNNAGTLEASRRLTADGIEADFAVNVVAPYVLTRALLGSFAPGARVVNVTGGLPFYGLDVADLQAEKAFVGLPTYSRTKRALEAMSLELARELESNRVNVLVVYPGEAATAMSGAMTPATMPWWMRPMYPLIRLMVRDDGGKSAAKASRSSVWAASSAEPEGLSGRAFDEHSRPLELHPTVLDPALRAQLMEQVRALAGRGAS